jgi:polyferredoxin
MENKDVFVRTFPLVWVFTIVVALVLFFTAGKVWALSFVLGSVTSLMMMSMLYKSSKKVLSEEKSEASKLAIRNYAFRFAFYALILVVSALMDNLEILGTAVGLFSFKIVLYFNMFLESRGERK